MDSMDMLFSCGACIIAKMLRKLIILYEDWKWYVSHSNVRSIKIAPIKQFTNQTKKRANFENYIP